MKKKEYDPNTSEISEYYLSTYLDYEDQKWKPLLINHWKTKYSVNKYGVVLDRDKKVVVTEHRGRYITYELEYKDKKVNIGKHRLIAALFIPIPKRLLSKGYTQVSLVPNHKDGNKYHNVIENLEWTSPKENAIHARDNELLTYEGENSHLATVTKDEIIRVCELLSAGNKCKNVALVTGVSESIVRHVYNREAWINVSKNYKFRHDRQHAPYSIKEEVIHAICEKLESGMRNIDIANELNVKPGLVKDIRTGRRHSDISKNYSFVTNTAKERLSDDDIRKICELLVLGKGITEIANELNVNTNTVSE